MPVTVKDLNGGLAKAQEMLLYLKELGASTVGVQLRAEQRDDGTSNNDLIEWHKVGIKRKDGTVVVRDITPTTKDANDAAMLFHARAENRLRLISSQPKGKVPDVSKIKAMAENAAASGLKAAAALVSERMRQRIQDAIDSGGSPLTAVTEETAEARKRKYGTPEDAVLMASGQLIRNFERGRNIVLTRITNLSSAIPGLG